MAASWNVKVNMAAGPLVGIAANRALALSAEYLLETANRTAPIEEATLIRSGAVSTDPANYRAAVSYDTPYAVRQHEDMTLRHDQGRRAKWLELTFAEESVAVQQILLRVIKGAL